MGTQYGEHSHRRVPNPHPQTATRPQLQITLPPKTTRHRYVPRTPRGVMRPKSPAQTEAASIQDREEERPSFVLPEQYMPDVEVRSQSHPANLGKIFRRKRPAESHHETSSSEDNESLKDGVDKNTLRVLTTETKKIPTASAQRSWNTITNYKPPVAQASTSPPPRRAQIDLPASLFDAVGTVPSKTPTQNSRTVSKPACLGNAPAEGAQDLLTQDALEKAKELLKSLYSAGYTRSSSPIKKVSSIIRNLEGAHNGQTRISTPGNAHSPERGTATRQEESYEVRISDSITKVYSADRKSFKLKIKMNPGKMKEQGTDNDGETPNKKARLDAELLNADASRLTAHPANQPKFKFTFRLGKSADPADVAKQMKPHAAIEKTFDRHESRIINRTDGTWKEKVLPPRALEQRMEIDDSDSPPPGSPHRNASACTPLNERNLERQGAHLASDHRRTVTFAVQQAGSCYSPPRLQDDPDAPGQLFVENSGEFDPNDHMNP